MKQLMLMISAGAIIAMSMTSCEAVERCCKGKDKTKTTANADKKEGCGGCGQKSCTAKCGSNPAVQDSTKTSK